jgi:hypothetical protein
MTLERSAIVSRGRRLEYFTVAWNVGEGLLAVAFGIVAGSISLVGFGLDSFIEVTSGAVLLWRMSVDADVRRRELNERRALRLVGVSGARFANRSIADSYRTYRASNKPR